MEKREQLNALESRQLELQATMSKSDAHASKCSKLGLNFKKTYPDEYSEYESAREEYNRNEEQLAALRAEPDPEPEPVIHEED